MSLQDAIKRNRAAQAAKRAKESQRAAAVERGDVRMAVARVALVLAMPEMDSLIERVEHAISRDSVDYDVTGEAYDYVRAFVRCYRDAQRAAADVSETLGWPDAKAEVAE